MVFANSGRLIWYDIALHIAESISNVFIEISSIPPKNLLKAIPNLYEISEKIIYGSDFPAFKGKVKI